MSVKLKGIESLCCFQTMNKVDTNARNFRFFLISLPISNLNIPIFNFCKNVVPSYFFFYEMALNCFYTLSLKSVVMRVIMLYHETHSCNQLNKTSRPAHERFPLNWSHLVELLTILRVINNIIIAIVQFWLPWCETNFRGEEGASSVSLEREKVMPDF